MRASRRGNALILVLIVASGLAVLSLVAAQLAVKTSDTLREEARSTQLQNELEAAIELFRLELVRTYAKSGQPASTWVPSVPLDRRRAFAPYPDVVCWVSRASAPNSPSQWLELTASTLPASRVRQSVRQLINFDRSSIWDLAILCETTDCMACHLQVRGDWGTLFDNFRPGHDVERSGIGTLALGRLYTPKRVVRAQGEAAGGNKVNGAEFTGGVEENSSSAKLPVDADTGEIALPRLKPGDIQAGIEADMAAGRAVGLGENATTPISPGSMAEMYALPHFKDQNGNGQPDPGEWVSFARNSDPLAGAGLTAGDAGSEAIGYRVEKIPPVWDGNLVLVGTVDRPIVLNGDVFVTGDVVIKGYVTGKGTIYAGRNTYVAGDVVYKNPPSQMLDVMRTGVGDPDQAAQADLAGNTDELRLAARANLVLGDYVETSGGKVLPIKDRQAADFFRLQFGFNPEAPDQGKRYFTEFKPDPDGAGPLTAVPSIEVKPDPSTPGTFRPFDWRPQDGGAAIDGSEVRLRDGYEALRPSVLESVSNGKAHDWIGDDQYRNVLGTQQLDMNTYRGFIPSAPVSGDIRSWGLSPEDEDQAKREEMLAKELGLPTTILAGDSDSFVEWIDDWNDGCVSCLAKGGRFSFDPDDPSGASWDSEEYQKPLVTVFKKGVMDEEGNVKGYTLRVLDERVQTYPDQTEVVDAFIYSNARIAGMTQTGTNLTVNGGMISGEIGLLAPGRRAVLDSSMDAWMAGDPSGETGTSGLYDERHYAWRMDEGLTSQGVGWPSDPNVTADPVTGNAVIASPLDGFNGNFSEIEVQIWYETDVISGGGGYYTATLRGGTYDVVVGTGYGTETRTIWDPNQENTGYFDTLEQAQNWLNSQLSQPVTARPSLEEPPQTMVRGAGGWGGSSTGAPNFNGGGEPSNEWEEDFYRWVDVESYPGSGTPTTEADLRALLNARLAALGLPPDRVEVVFSDRSKYKQYGTVDQLNGWNWVDASNRERDAFLNRWWRGNVTLNDGRRTNLAAQGNQVNPANGEKYGGATVNYDFRLRNGGLGFARIGDDVGKRLVWLPTGYVPPP